MKKKLLLADDSITIQKVVGIIFATEDCELLIAGDGDKAYDMALTYKPDLVIADISMPGKNGFDLCREIKSNPALATTSVLLLPGAFEEFDETRAIDVCADGWLTKPFESQALLEKVAALVAMPPLRLVEAEETALGMDLSDTSDESLSIADDTSVLLDEQEADTDQTDQLEAEPDADDESDLWDAVSFEEEDLSPQDLLAAGDRDDDEGSSDFSALDDPAPESSEVLTPEQLAPYVSAFAQPVEETSSSASQWETTLDPDVDADEDAFATDEADFESTAEEIPSSVYTDVAGVEEFVAEPPQLSAEEPSAFQFLGAQDDPSEDFEDESDEVLELMETDLDQDVELVEDADTFIDLSAADQVEAFGSDSEATPLSSIGVAAEAGGYAADDAEEEIIELSESEIVAREDSFATPGFAPEFVEDLTDADEEGGFAAADEEEIEPIDSADEVDGDYIFTDSEPEAVVPAQSAEEERYLLFEDADETDTEPSVEPEPAFQEAVDESFIYDVSSDDIEAEQEEAVIATDKDAEFSTEGALPDVAESVPSGAAVVGAPVKRVEEQLSQLSEEELKQVVTKVAGPLIEAMARDMLQHIIWEVVPDLAETMISEEIEKIKQGM